MEEVQRFHEYLLRQRTQIRNNRRTLRAMKDCWKLLLRADPNSMSRGEYKRMYSTLLYEMTIYWDEETNEAIQAKMWHRDVSLFENLDFNRFCCSIFFFVEMWVQEVTQDSYDKIFSIVRSILAGHFPRIPSTVDASDSPFKPTLESFDDAFDRERDLENMNLNIGKSITFDANKYFQYFGSPTATIQASNIILLQFREWSARTSTLLSEANIRRRHSYERATICRVPKAGCSNPKLLRPVSSRQSHLSIYNSRIISTNAPLLPTCTSPPHTTRPVLLTGATALKTPTFM